VSAGLPAVLAIDGGNSKTDVTIVGSDGVLLAEIRGPGTNPQNSSLPEAMQVLSELVGAAARSAGLTMPPGQRPGEQGGRAGWHGLVAAHTSACMAGADLPEEEEELTAALTAMGWSSSTSVVNDTFAVLRAGLDDSQGTGQRAHWGVAVTCGAGINCVGVGPDGQATRFLALGQLSGDWGGGGALGGAALWWAIRAEDGRGPQTQLREAVAKYFSVPEVRDVVIGVHLGRIPHEDLLGLAPVLFEVADRGDQVARNLVARLAEEICAMALTAARRLGLTEAAVPVVLGGSLLTAANPLLTTLINDKLAAGAPAARPRIVSGPPVAGAALLGLDHVAAPPAAYKRLRSAYN
jgi:N-acetylglucosamine kinase-like BadF-type ATPase